MGIPLSEILDEDNSSMREQAAANHLPYDPFTMRELITPQYQPDEVDLETSEETWENWVGQHETWEDDDGQDVNGRTELRPADRTQLVAAVVQKAHNGGKVRAVGSGHSHSNAPAPEESYIELNPGFPGDPRPHGLNDVLPQKWLKDDDELRQTGLFDTTVSDDEEIPEVDDGPDAAHLKRLEAGIILRRLNRHILHPEGYALENMGSFDGQTIAGAVNTSTHGTGIGLASISDAVKSVEIATVPESESGDPIVRLYRIEPSEGITDRDAFEADTGDHEMELIQDDDIFHSVVVGYGCMGVVYAYTMGVVDNYWLREENQLISWRMLRDELEPNPSAFLTKDGTRHCQIFVNTATQQVAPGDVRAHESSDEDHGVLEDQQHESYQNPLCLVRRFIPTEIPDEKPDDWENFTKQTGLKDIRWPPERRAPPFQDAGQDLLKYHPFFHASGKSKQLHNNFFHPSINKDPFVGGYHKSAWYVVLRRLRDEGDPDTSQYYHPQPPRPATPTTEIGVGARNVVELIDEFLEKVEDTALIWGNEEDGFGDRYVFFAAPMGIRFTAPSSHYLSPEYGRETAMVELPLPLPHEKETVGDLRPAVPELNQDEMRNQVVLPALEQVEKHIREELSDLYPRPHMGKVNTVDAAWLDQNYQHFDASDSDEVATGWYQAYQRFNAFGTFDNDFTDQLGLSTDFSVQSGDLQETAQPTESGDTAQATETDGTDPSAEGATGTEHDAVQQTEDGVEVSQPGLGFLAGLAGVGTGAWLLNRQADGNDDAAETGDDPPGSPGDTGPDTCEPADQADDTTGRPSDDT